MFDHPEKDPDIFQLFLLKPSHYDDNGYVIQWVRSDIPSNTLAALNAIALDCRQRHVLGNTSDIDIRITAIDETNCRVEPKKIIRAIEACGGTGLVALVGVQSNQFPRAVDIARPLRQAGIPVCIGGFHTAGSLAMLPETPVEIQAAWDLGISIFCGEAEGRLDEVLQDAYRGRLKPLYDYTADLPGLESAPPPFLPLPSVGRNLGLRSSFEDRACRWKIPSCFTAVTVGSASRSLSGFSP